MKNLFRWMTVAALMGGGFLFAAEDTTTPKDGKDAKVEKADAPKRGPADENLTPEQREARRKEMAAKRTAKLKELKEKKAAGTLTEKEQKMLDRLEKGRRPGGPGKPPAGEKKTEPTK